MRSLWPYLHVKGLGVSPLTSKGACCVGHCIDFATCWIPNIHYRMGSPARSCVRAALDRKGFVLWDGTGGAAERNPQAGTRRDVKYGSVMVVDVLNAEVELAS